MTMIEPETKEFISDLGDVMSQLQGLKDNHPSLVHVTLVLEHFTEATQHVTRGEVLGESEGLAPPDDRDYFNASLNCVDFAKACLIQLHGTYVEPRDFE